jgi:hypothetical protein
LPGVGELTVKKVRRIVDDWKTRPLERQAMQAVRVAYVANQWVKANPDDSLSAEIKATLPKALRDGSDAALNATPPRPGFAFEFATAYLQLAFAPPDPEMERRVLRLQGKGRPGNRRRPVGRE